MNINFLRANNGDSIHISFNDNEGCEKNILIDGGKKSTYQFKNDKKKKEDGALKMTIDCLRRQDKKFDLVILTHVDEDHIGGFISWIEKDPEAYKMIGKVWFNSGKTISDWLKFEKEPPFKIIITPEPITGQTSIPQGVQFETYLKYHQLWDEEVIKSGDEKTFHGLKFKFLSPDKERLEDLLKDWKKEAPDSLTGAKINDHGISLMDHHLLNKKITDQNFEEDDAVPNGSSLAFLLCDKESNYLFLGDAFPSVIAKALEDLDFSPIKPIEAKLVKVSHHGARSNTNNKVFKMIKSKDFIISTNSKQDNHPHKQLISRLIDNHPNSNIHFNYSELIPRIFTKQDYADFPYFKALPITEPFKY